MDRHPTLLQVMTPFPQFIGDDATPDEAAQMMEAHEIHHLPVKDERGYLIGLVTSVDLDRVLGAEPRPRTVAGLCRRDVHVVDVNRRLASVAREMAAGRANAVLVTRDDHLVGIITTTDICRVLAELLEPDIDDIIA